MILRGKFGYRCRTGLAGEGQEDGPGRARLGAGAGPGRAGGGGGRACSYIKTCVGSELFAEKKTWYFSPDFPREVPDFFLDISDVS